MKALFKLVGLLAMAGIWSSCGNNKEIANYQVIPLPQEVTMTSDGEFAINNGTQILYPENNEKMQRKDRKSVV